MSLFRIWNYDFNDRCEIARFKADDFDEVQEYLLKNFIWEESQERVEKTDFGLEWNEFTKEECIEQHAEDKDCDACIYGPNHGLRCKESNLECVAFELDPDYDPCNMCDGCITGFEIEEVEDPTDDEFEFKTIYGTNEYYDLTIRKALEKKLEEAEKQYYSVSEDPLKGTDVLTKLMNQYRNERYRIIRLLETEVEKAEDWNKKLSGAWNKSPKHGIAALLLSKITPQGALSEELKERSKKKLEEIK